MSKQQQQAGVVSIIVATMLIIIVSLIVVAFSQVSRREQRESLDAQLSTQAYYAAETGINAATTIAQANPSSSQPSCKATTAPYNVINYDLNTANPNTVAITCLTIDTTPGDLSSTLNMNTASVLPIIPASGAGISSLTFSWPKSSGFSKDKTACQSAPQVSGAYKLPTETTWNSTWGCPFGGIRADFVPGGNLNRDFLIANDKVSFMLPASAGTGAGVLNNVSLASCGTTTCSVTYSGLGYSTMYLRLISLYQGGFKVKITGTDSTGTAIDFVGAQAKIDSTGRAQDVLRRIVVSAPLQGSGGKAPIQALVSGDSVCKRVGVAAGFYQNYAPNGTGCQ